MGMKGTITTLYLVRHGETEGSETARYKGSIDVPLSRKGVEQMTKTASLIAGILSGEKASSSTAYLREVHRSDSSGPARLSAVYCSDLQRSRVSAEIIAEPCGLRPVVVSGLRERNFGRWEGMSFAEIQELYPVEFRQWAENPLLFTPVKGETTLEVRDRAVTALEKVVGDHPGENIAVVAHGGVNRVILCHLLGIPFENLFRVEQAPGGVSVIEFWEHYPVIKLLNGVAYE